VCQRPIVPADWTRFVAHAGRVRTFIYRDYDNGGWFYPALSMAATEEVLLPNLKELHWDVGFEEDDTFTFIRLFLGPHIKRLHLSLSGDLLVRLSFLHSLPLRYPSLTHVHLVDNSDQMDAERFAILNAVSRVVCGWSQLRHLSVPNLSPVALRHLAVLPTLEQLTLTDVIRDTPMAWPRSHTVPFFPSLRELQLTCDEMSFSIGLVEAMSSSPLTSITIHTYDDIPPLECQDLFNALQGHCRHSSVTSIIMDFSDISGHEDEPGIIPIHLKPLFVFSNLTNVTLGLPYGAPFDLDDTTMNDLALAWPRIRSLVLKGVYWGGTDSYPCVTILGLVPLAQHCPELRALSIRFDARSLPHLVADSPTVTSEALMELNVLTSPIVEPEGVAAFLFDIFPRAYVKYDADGLSKTLIERWQQVGDLMHACLRSASEG